MKTIQSDGYPIFFENSLQELALFAKQGNYSRVFILTDENTGEHCLPLLQKHLEGAVDYDLIEVPSGEENKTIDFCLGIWKMLIDFGADRKALMVNLGGGVITDQLDGGKAAGLAGIFAEDASGYRTGRGRGSGRHRLLGAESGGENDEQACKSEHGRLLYEMRAEE